MSARPASSSCSVTTQVRLPHGVRDYLPAAAAHRRAIAEGLLHTFEAWGYRRIITPAFEYEAVLALGLGAVAQAQAVKFVEPLSGEIVALRPDITPQVARLVATRLKGEPGPIRLCYEGSVVRMGGGAAPQRELFQAGVELVDAPSPAGDVEVIALAASALAAAGVSEFTLDLGDVSVVRAALAGIDDPALREAVGRKDAEAVARAAHALGLPRERRRLLEALPSLYGGPEAIDRAASLLGPRQREAGAGLAALATVVERLGHFDLAGSITIDLGEIRAFDYYTGVRFQGFATGAGEALLSGGRYDRLIERYGRPAGAAGFAVDVERVALALKALGAPRAQGLPVVLVAGDIALAARVATRLREGGTRVALDLVGPRRRRSANAANESRDPPTARGDRRLADLAVRAGCERVIVLASDGGARFFEVAGERRKGRVSPATLTRALQGGTPLDALLLAR
ncbi:MAG: ATP phosphoribosyltransferase regulatory subunit [Myxococcales bacterium]|nr:ATP phosphoribosyltransferase regulatory subunit [Myxococcales bacterium]